MQQDRNYIYIRGRKVMHSTARRDWVCGKCESPLITDAEGTYCSKDFFHSKDGFITKKTLERRIHEQLTQGHALERMGRMPLKDRDTEFGTPKRMRLVRVGKVRQGKMEYNEKAKRKVPVATPYFIIDPETDNDIERQGILEGVWAAIEEKAPGQDPDMPTTLPITFLANVDEIIAPESYKHRKGKKGMVWCAGDGEFIQWKLDDEFRVEISGGEKVSDGKSVPCPGRNQKGRHAWCDDCSGEIEINFVVDGFESTGTWQLRTKSMTFRDQFWTAVGMVRLMADKGIISGFVGAPFLLRRRMEEVTVPMDDGKLIMRSMPITSIEVEPKWFREQISRNPRLALPEPDDTPKQITAAEMDYPEVVEAEVVNEPPWYEKADYDLPNHAWTAEEVGAYITATMAHYNKEHDDFDEPASESEIQYSGGLLYKALHDKLGFTEQDAIAARDVIAWGLFGGEGDLVKSQAAALIYWAKRPATIDGKLGTAPRPTFVEEVESFYNFASKLADEAGQDAPMTPEEDMARMGAKKVDFKEPESE